MLQAVHTAVQCMVKMHLARALEKRTPRECVHVGASPMLGCCRHVAYSGC
jgi:hypothetical protein